MCCGVSCSHEDTSLSQGLATPAKWRGDYPCMASRWRSRAMLSPSFRQTGQNWLYPPTSGGMAQLQTSIGTRQDCRGRSPWCVWQLLRDCGYWRGVLERYLTLQYSMRQWSSVKTYVGSYFCTHYNSFVIKANGEVRAVDVHTLADHRPLHSRQNFDGNEKDLYISLPYIN